MTDATQADKPEAAQAAQARKAAAMKAGRAEDANRTPPPPSLTPQEWSICHQALDALFRAGVPGAQAAVAILGVMQKIEAIARAAEPAEG